MKHSSSLDINRFRVVDCNGVYTRFSTSFSRFCFYVEPTPFRKSLNSVELKSYIYGP